MMATAHIEPQAPMQRAWADLPKPFPLCAPLPRSLSKRQDGCGFGSGRGPLRLLRLVEILAPAGADVEAMAALLHPLRQRTCPRRLLLVQTLMMPAGADVEAAVHVVEVVVGGSDELQGI